MRGSRIRGPGTGAFQQEQPDGKAGLILKSFFMVPAYPHQDQALTFRSSKRLTITLPQATLEALSERSNEEGRSLSNLAAYLLESALEQRDR